MLKKLPHCCSGATAIEYCLVASLIALSIVGVMSQVGGQSNGMLSQVYDDVANAMAR
ncbi:Flp family type IVb pilin [Allosphingosinicella flava]|uniref:Flp family type IVb pilin n=1 Tax=Allosphingosinicella flava TaxID=2771430 RepID=A0A7T2LN96_9SPHN|nr:Flp family type IVb pilin [Sphingosinicella flava]QPQ55957.1 Flp family type IVb pilin [Sphingosinicella flava]